MTPVMAGPDAVRNKPGRRDFIAGTKRSAGYWNRITVPWVTRVKAAL